MNNTTIGKLVKEGIIEEPMDGNHGELHPTSKDYVTTGIPFIMASDIENGCVNYSSCKYITKETANTLRKGFAFEGDVLLTHKATIGRTAILKKLPTEFAMLTPQVTYYRIKKPSVLHPYYLKYYFDSPYFQTIIKQRAGAGSTRAYIGILQQNELPISYPKYEIQKQVVDVLKSLDDKIENNYYISTELETMSKTIYDYWFVQFDFPDENGKPYRTSGGEMVWNEQLKQEIPKGWKSGTIGDLGTIVSGGTPNTSCDEYYCTDGYAWITPNDLSGNTDKMFINHGERDVTVEGIENSSAVLMPKHTVLLSTRAPIGYLAISENEVCTNQGFKSIVPDAGYSEFYIYYVLKSNIPAIAQQGVGTTFKEVSKETLSGFKIPLPPIELTERFVAHILAGCTKRRLLENECRELSKLRDWLLPMLMNGQARVE